MTSMITRNVIARASGALDRFPIVAIQGARRVGKSTLATAMVAGRPSTTVSLDTPEELLLARQDPQQLIARRNGGTMVIDEVQRAPELLLSIKADVDRAGTPGCYVLTGSSDFTSLPQVPDSLAGRAVTIELGPFSMGELARVKEDFVSSVCAGLDTLPEAASPWTRDEYVDAVVAGGYPELRPLEGEWRQMWADSYVDRLTSRDVLDVAERVAAPRLRAILDLVAANQAGELVKARLAQAATISVRSVTTCLDVLQALYVVTSVSPWTNNLTKRQIGRAKALVLDSGLACHLTGAEADFLRQPLGHKALGPLLEGFVMAELIKQRSWSASRWSLSHFRDRDGLEVDGVIQLADGRVILLEVKAAQTYRTEHFAPMQKLADELGDRLVAGVVLSLSDRTFRYGEKLWGLPVSALWGHGRAA